jgi:transcription elongation GreA/GreB family factor
MNRKGQVVNKFPITVFGAEKMRSELQHLKSVERPAVIQAIAEFERLLADSKVTLVNFADTASQQAVQQAGQTPPENVPAD